MSDAIRCPNCGAMKSRIRDSRPSKEHANAVRRRRVCACGERFTTLEMTSYDIDALIEANRVLFQLAERAQQALEQEAPND